MKKTGSLMVSRKGRWSHISPIYGMICLFITCLVMIGSGCSSYAEPGESAAETNRRHHRTIRANYSQMIEDIDKLLMLDKPSSLNSKRLPR